MIDRRPVQPGAAVRWGIVGGGPMADGFVADLRQVEGAAVVAVTSRTPESAARAGERLGIDRVHGDLDAFAADERIDVAYVATPHDTHAPVATALLEAGVPVLCEKPFALDADEARSMAAVARGGGVFCMEAMWTRFVPAVTRALALVADGAIGEVVEVHADFSMNVPVREGDRRFDPGSGGGALLDLGVYGASIADMFLGPVASADDAVASHVAIGPSGVDERITALLRHESGGSSVVGASIVSQGPNRAFVIGTTGTIELPGPICAPDRLVLRRHGGRIDPSQASGGLAARLTALPGAAHVGSIARKVRDRITATKVERLPPNGNGYTHEIDEVHRCLRSALTESAAHDLDTTIRVADTLDRIRRSAPT